MIVPILGRDRAATDMRTFMLASLLALVLVLPAFAHQEDKITLRVGQQKSAMRGDLKIKFVRVLEDSRCPRDVNCIWAGNAKVELKVTGPDGNTKTIVVNTMGNLTNGPSGGQFDTYAINLVGLTPQPVSGRKLSSRDYRLALEVRRITR